MCKYADVQMGECADVQIEGYLKGSLVYSTSVKDVTNWFKKGDNYFLLLGEDQDEFPGFDFVTGKLKGSMKEQKTIFLLMAVISLTWIGAR